MNKNILFMLMLLCTLSACASKESEQLTPEDQEMQNAQLEKELAEMRTTIGLLQGELLEAEEKLKALDKEAKKPVPARPAPVRPATPPVDTSSTTAEQENENQLPSLPVQPSTENLPTISQPASEKVENETIVVDAPPKVLTESEKYQIALNLYRSGQFKKSHQAFTTFLREYPSSRYAANALYWDGENYYSQALYADAILTFKDILARFPKSNKSADALLKIALSYKKLNDLSNSALHVTVLLEDWPNSEAAAKAKQLNLQTL